VVYVYALNMHKYNRLSIEYATKGQVLEQLINND